MVVWHVYKRLQKRSNYDHVASKTKHNPCSTLSFLLYFAMNISSDDDSDWEGFEGMPMVNRREEEEMIDTYCLGQARELHPDTEARSTRNPKTELFDSTRFGTSGRRRCKEKEEEIRELKASLGIPDMCFKACCATCSTYLENNTIPTSAKLGQGLRSTFLKRNGGCVLGSKEAIVTVLRQHKEGKLHRYIELQNNQLDIRLSMERALYSKNEILVRIMRIAMTCVDQYQSFLSFEHQVRCHHLNGCDVGNRQHSRKQMKEIVLCVGDLFLEDMKHAATSRHPLSGHLLYIGSMADKITDGTTSQWQGQMHYQAHEGVRTLFLTGLEQVTEAAAPVNGEEPIASAGGRSCFDKKVVCFQEKCGIDLHEDVRDNGQTLQVRSYMFDGEAVYQGRNNGVKHYLHHEDGIGDPTQYVGWDPAHDQDLANAALGKEIVYIVDVIDVTVKEVYAHFSRSPQKLRGLEAMATAVDCTLKQLHYLFEVRFIESQVKAYTAFIHDLPIILVTLKKDLAITQANGGPTPEKRTKMTKWVRHVSSIKFPIMLASLLDVHGRSQIYSKQVQSDSTFVIDLPTFREQLFKSLENLRQTNPGQVFVENGYVRRHLPGWKEGKHINTDGAEMIVTTQGKSANTSTSDWALNRTKTYLDDIATKLLTALDDKMKPPEIAIRLRTMLDVRRMPEITNNANDANAGGFDTHGHAEIDWIVEEEFKHLDAVQLKQDLNVYLHFIKDNRASFEEYITPTKIGSARTNFTKTINMSRVFEYFSTNSTPGEMKQLIEVIDYTLAFATGSCAVERIGRVMNLTKNDLRAALGDEIFFHLVFVKFSMPALEDFDWERILERWYNDGHMDAVSKSARESSVLKRLRDAQAKRSHTPIGTKKRKVASGEEVVPHLAPMVPDHLNGFFSGDGGGGFDGDFDPDFGIAGPAIPVGQQPEEEEEEEIDDY